MGYHVTDQHTHHGSSTGEEREKGAERIFEEINIPNLMKILNMNI